MPKLVHIAWREQHNAYSKAHTAYSEFSIFRIIININNEDEKFMGFKEQLNFLENSKEFSDWKAENKDCYLVHCFVLVEDSSPVDWQIGYYNPGTSKITTFKLDEKQITINPEAEVFKKDKEKLKPLEQEKVKIDLNKAIAIAEKLQQEKYPSEKPMKKIFILQHLDIGQVWNTTYLTQSYKTLNIRIDSETGEIKQDQLIDIVGFVKGNRKK